MKKKFKFSLQALLDFRLRKEDEIKGLLGQKHGEIENQKKEIQSLEQSLKELQRSEKESRGSGEDILSMRYSVSYRNHLKLTILKQGRKFQDLGAEAEAIRKELVKATQKRKAVEKIKEHKLREWKKEQNRNQQIFSDEIAQQAFIRSAHETGS
ncbi:flagellar export protein FliJ [Chitinispirillales bacterium ANBcel5]|uniref:flagellar export protein FliJ n=1 Tax=Cellulosispirillum alkaliphilum TaxID=3039283 RepID=UPI002A545019|nr:flagellar export protein FliJ [Chitinispirillales bacterium ANBcel5]